MSTRWEAIDDRVLTELIWASATAAAAVERVTADRRAGRVPGGLDLETVHRWVTTVEDLAGRCCAWHHPDMKALGARLHDLAAAIREVLPHHPDARGAACDGRPRRPPHAVE